MKKIKTIIFSLLLLAMVAPATSVYSKDDGGKKEKKEKPAKEAKPLVWKKPALTGNKDFDEYLRLCDELYTKIETYSAQIPYYKVQYYKNVNLNTGEVIKNEDGEVEYIAVIEDQNGKIRNAGGVMKQYATVILAGTNILLDCTNLAVSTASATAALPSLGAAALTYGKYIKQGPLIAKKGINELTTIVENLKAQSASIKALKAGSTAKSDLAVSPEHTMSSEVIVAVTTKSQIMELGLIGDDINIDDMPNLTQEKVAEANAAVNDEELKAYSDSDLI
ncbi:MAG: hypothetical protein SNJ29_10810 [Rikenellaceae bacterium]